MKEVFVLNVVCGPNMVNSPSFVDSVNFNNQASYTVGKPD
jgi:hypothetical protein